MLPTKDQFLDKIYNGIGEGKVKEPPKEVLFFNVRPVTGPGGVTTTTMKGGSTTKPSTSGANPISGPMTGQYITGAIVLLCMHIFTLGVWIKIKI